MTVLPEEVAREAAKAVVRGGSMGEVAILGALDALGYRPMDARAGLAFALLKEWLVPSPAAPRFGVGGAWWEEYNEAVGFARGIALTVDGRVRVMSAALKDAGAHEGLRRLQTSYSVGLGGPTLAALARGDRDRTVFRVGKSKA